MTVKEFKEWVSKIPEEYNEFSIGIINTDDLGSFTTYLHTLSEWLNLDEDNDYLIMING